MKDVLAELKSQRIWVLFQVAKQGKRLMKRPCAANGGPTGSNYDYKDTWVTYPEAVKAQKKQIVKVYLVCQRYITVTQ